MNQSKRSTYPFISLAKIIAGMLNFKQNGASVVNCKEEFKQEEAAVASLMCIKWCAKFVENTEEYGAASETERKDILEAAFDQLHYGL